MLELSHRKKEERDILLFFRIMTNFTNTQTSDHLKKIQYHDKKHP